ncbi:protein-glutamate methylesterase/protein-glutamine glutaminase [Candidatus Alkanophaga liquidiphilum]
MSMSGEKKIGVLVVDDSAFMRILISDMLCSDEEVEVVGVARDGEDALEKLEELSPDVITMDVEMPRLDGIGALKEIMRQKPTPVIMLSAHTQEGARTTLEALESGAFDFVPKPSGSISLDIEKVRSELLAKIKAAARARGTTLTQGRRVSKAGSVAGFEPGRRSERVVVIAASTGGPRALSEVLFALPASLPAGVLVVQHMPPFFTRALAERLNAACELQVKEAENGDEIKDGCVLIAPGDFHMLINDRKVELNKEPPVNAVRPSADVTMRSAADAYGENVVGVVLTGMGRDGAAGIIRIKERGGRTIACDERTSLIFGMPKAAIETGCVDIVAPLHEIPKGILNALNGG